MLMNLYFTDKDKVGIYTTKFIKRTIGDFPEKITKLSAIPALEHLLQGM